MAAALVTALLSTSRKTGIALAADRALNVGLFGKEAEGWLIGIFATTTKTKNKVKGGVLLDGIVLEGVAVLELLTSEDKTLLVWWDTFLVLDFSLDILDTVGWFNFEGDVLAGKSLNEDLHSKREGQNRLQLFNFNLQIKI